MGELLRILVIEDSADDAELLLREVRKGGYEVEAERVETAEAMQRALAQRQWDLILSDHSMPHFSSVRALDVLNQSGLDLPFLIVSGSIGEDAAVAALKSGAHDFLTKGRLARLIPAIQRELREAEIRREQKRAAEQLRLSDQILQRVKALVVVADSKGEIVFVSRAASLILGYKPEELLGDGWWNVSRPSSAEALIERERVAQVARGEMPPASDPYERSIQDRSGAAHWIEWVEALGPEGLVIGVGHDVTERRQAEEKIQRQLQRMSALRSIDLAISSTFDMRLSLAVLLSVAVTQLEASAATVLLFDPHSLMLEYAAGHGFHTPGIQRTRLRIGEGLAGRVALERRAVQVPRLAQAGSEFVRAELLAEEVFVAYYGVPLISKGELKGVLEVFHRAELRANQEWQDFLETLAGQAAIAIDNARLFDSLQRSNLELGMAYDATIEGWSRAMDLRDKETEGHTLRVTEITLQLAELLGVDAEKQVHMRRGALLHDMGKLGVPDNILLKPGKLTEEEWEVMRKHPQFAYDMLAEIAYLKPALEIPYCHHEKWDGGGYPRGLKGHEIPLAARIFSVVDVWDALTSDRPYRGAWSAEQTREYIREQAGQYFDPRVVEHFLKMIITR